MRRSTVCLALALWIVAGCARSTPPSPTTIVSTSTAPPSIEPAPTAVELTETAPAPTQLPTDTPQPTPEGLLRLTNNPARDSYPAWSGDGQRIAFYSDRTGVDEIYVMNVDGIGLVQLTQDADIQFKEDPAWSPDGRQIAFTALFDVWRIFAFDVETAVAQPFSPSEPTSEGYPKPLSDYYKDSFSPDWSPDGRQIVFKRQDFFLEWQVHILDVATGVVRQVTDVPGSVYQPRWSPDGRHIAFATQKDGNFEVYVVSPDGNGLTQLTIDPAYDSRPSWSPGGRFIVFSSDRGGSYGLHVMRADGSYILQLNTDSGEAFDPAWSPDGRSIAFVSNRDGNHEIYLIRAPTLEP